MNEYRPPLGLPHLFHDPDGFGDIYKWRSRLPSQLIVSRKLELTFEKKVQLLGPNCHRYITGLRIVQGQLQLSEPDTIFGLKSNAAR